MRIKRFEDIEACQLARECVAIRGFIKSTSWFMSNVNERKVSLNGEL